MTLDERVKGIVCREIGVPAETPIGAIRYESIPEWTSGSHMNIILAIEDEFGIELDADEIVEATDVSSIAALIRKVAPEAPAK